MTSVAVLHPGSMGAAVAHEARTNAETVRWLSTGRSPATTQRAHDAGLTAVSDPAELFATTDIVISLCPPGAPADELADLTLANAFQGTYVDANAISPTRMTAMAQRLEAADIQVVDASIIGPPPSPTSPSTLYLCGPPTAVTQVAALFHDTHLATHNLDRPIGAASALKAAYASYNKGATVLAALAHALAAEHGLTEELLAEAEASLPGSPLASQARLRSSVLKAWRWVPEFEEIATTMSAAALPDAPTQALADVLTLWSDLKDHSEVPLDEALTHLRRPS